MTEPRPWWEWIVVLVLIAITLAGMAGAILAPVIVGWTQK